MRDAWPRQTRRFGAVDSIGGEDGLIWGRRPPAKEYFGFRGAREPPSSQEASDSATPSTYAPVGTALALRARREARRLAGDRRRADCGRAVLGGSPRGLRRRHAFDAPGRAASAPRTRDDAMSRRRRHAVLDWREQRRLRYHQSHAQAATACPAERRRRHARAGPPLCPRPAARGARPRSNNNLPRRRRGDCQMSPALVQRKIDSN